MLIPVAILNIHLNQRGLFVAQNITFSMIKPDAVSRGLIGAILQKLESKGLRMRAGKLIRMDKTLSEAFYQDHKTKPFFDSLVQFVSSGPVFVMALEGENAVAKTRELMGHTDPSQALPGTIRSLYGENIERNSIHGSDSEENAKKELKLFFEEL